MSKELINKRLDELKSMASLKDNAPIMPIDTYISEAEALFKICIDDKDELMRIGLDWSIYEDIPLRVAALREGQSKWISEYKQYQDCQARWNLLAPEGFKLRDELIHHFYFAFSDLPKEYLKVKMIAKDPDKNSTETQELEGEGMARPQE